MLITPYFTLSALFATASGKVLRGVPSFGGKPSTENSELVDSGKERSRQLFLSPRTEQEIYDTVCSDEFGSYFGHGATGATMATAAGGAFVAKGGLGPASAGLVGISFCVKMARADCPSGPNPYDEMKAFVVDYVDQLRDDVDKTNRNLVKAALLDAMDTMITHLETYADYDETNHWTEKQDTMDEILRIADQLHLNLFTPENTISNTIATLGITVNDWKAFTFDLAAFFAPVYIYSRVQELANYNELNRLEGEDLLDGVQLYSQYKDIVDAIEFYLDYFTSDETKENLFRWRFEQHSIEEEMSHTNTNCPEKFKGDGVHMCRNREGCQCHFSFTIRDDMDDDYLHEFEENKQVCFRSGKRYNYIFFKSDKYTDFDDRYCISSEAGALNWRDPGQTLASRIVKERTTKWVNEFWDEDLWIEFAKNAKIELDHSFGYQLRFGDQCLTSGGQVFLKTCDDHESRQQWELSGQRRFKLAISSGDGFLSVKNDILKVSGVANTDWYFGHVEDDEDKVYIRHNVERGFALSVDSGNRVILKEFQEGALEQQWYWDAPYVVSATDDSLCLAVPVGKQIDFRSEKIEFSGGQIKVVSCENGYVLYEHELDLQANDYTFHIKQRGTDLALGKDHKLDFYNEENVGQLWYLSDDGAVTNVVTGGSLWSWEFFERYPTVLEDQFIGMTTAVPTPTPEVQP